MDDLFFQTDFVAANAWRMMGLQDANPLSPSFGCLHLAYWRDKTSEFPDVRFQEGGAALGLLSLPAFDEWRAKGMLASSEELYQGFRAALLNWQAQQYPEGCFDEWYKGERGFAATEFPMIAFGLCSLLMGEHVKAPERRILIDVMTKAGHWLALRHDKVKANHEAAGAAAMALAWKATGEETFLKAAQGMMADTLSRQTEEGWFPEVGGMDLGYCSVLLDYAMLYVEVTGDQSPLPAMRKLFAFMAPHIEPDLTIMAEAGLCLNPYVSRLGFGLLSAHDEAAASLTGNLREQSPGLQGLTPYLADDLRFARWSYLPLCCWLMKDGFKTAAGGMAYPQGWTKRQSAAIAAYHQNDLHVFFSPAGGGAVRVYHGQRRLLDDPGLAVTGAGGGFSGGGYDPERAVAWEGNGAVLTSSLGPAGFFYPSFLSRLMLRLGCITPWSSRLLRSLIDAYRLKKRTAINQSAAPLAGEGGYVFTRTIAIEDRQVAISDELQGAGGVQVLCLARDANGLIAPEPMAMASERLRLAKAVEADGRVTLRIVSP
ncbi:MAG: hypothetical protein HQL44_05540 [Alphaproteobacteria bacterium]|nr:hypothetical protein [Alphaproteobacteria bacterium]